MAKLKMKMAMLLIPADEVMSDFCYNFARTLLKKLVRLVAEDRVFKDKVGSRGKLTDIATLLPGLQRFLTERSLTNSWQLPMNSSPFSRPRPTSSNTTPGRTTA